jgi:hypothetical protein
MITSAAPSAEPMLPIAKLTCVPASVIRFAPTCPFGLSLVSTSTIRPLVENLNFAPPPSVPPSDIGLDFPQQWTAPARGIVQGGCSFENLA